MIWFLALRSLGQRLVRTFLTTLGIAVAVGSTVIFLSLGEGLRQVYTAQLSAIGPDLQVSYGPFDGLSISGVPELPTDYIGELEAEADTYGITAITPLIFYVRGGLNPATSFLFQGLPAAKPIGEIYFDYEVLEGRSLSAEDEGRNVAVIGQNAAERARVGLGGTLRLNPQSSFEIVGVARSGGRVVDNAVVVPISSLQEAIGIYDRVNFLALELSEGWRAAEIGAALAGRFPDLGFQTREDVLGVINQAIRIGDVVRLGISAIALIVGAIAVANTVLMSVFERTREFGLVRALGAKPRFLFGLVLAESVLLSLIGAAVGVLLGRLGIFVVNNVSMDLIGLEVAALTLRLLLFAVALAIFMGLSSGLLPAARAARIPITVAMARE
ncbi:MAG: ABC transporter permease [Deinococcota bacterium]|nr:ABC transporter permease [Deinococcota bacterium]